MFVKVYDYTVQGVWLMALTEDAELCDEHSKASVWPTLSMHLLVVDVSVDCLD